MNYLIKTSWWKWITILLLGYTAVFGLMYDVPRLDILEETVRVLHFHVPMWFGMIFLLLGSVIYAMLTLSTNQKVYDLYSEQLAQVGIFFSVLGMITGMVWAAFTWGEPWSGDPKQNAAAIGMLIYLAYFILRGSIKDPDQRIRIAAVYNIFAFAALIPLLFVLPRLTDSLHPGSGGNPGFTAYDLDNNLRIVFYPAVLGWTLLGFWITTLKIRYRLLMEKAE